MRLRCIDSDDDIILLGNTSDVSKNDKLFNIYLDVCKLSNVTGKSESGKDVTYVAQGG